MLTHRKRPHRRSIGVQLLVATLVWITYMAADSIVTAQKCSRTPEGHGALKTPADGRFHVRIAENTARYTPGLKYTISLEGIEAGGRQRPGSMQHKFSGFMLVSERKSNESGKIPMSIGQFELMHNDTLTKIPCDGMVSHTTTTPKAKIQVLWIAPLPGSGCAVFKATVIEHRDMWYMDDGPLTKEFCEDEQSYDDLLPLTLETCSACSEAKYELTFEGLWSRNTHPKDFPSNNWLTRFSDIIGATHTNDYRFWEYGQPASGGLRQVAEHGATRELEAELKGRSEDIRTIIKARGLAYPNVTGKTFAVFRVDPKHHLMSFVSMIDPSPDWFVGVSRLELCLDNGSWVESKVLDLYPWDAGTDSGPTYISPDQPTNPADSIRRIRPDHPHDNRSPFYDETGSVMKPLARLYLLRQRLYEKTCSPDNGRSSNEGGGGGGGGFEGNVCATSKWSRWSKCDAECGSGNRYRQRQFLNPSQAEECRAELTERESCVSQLQPQCANPQSGEEEEIPADPMCELTAWGDFSECTPKCGPGTRSKRRKYKKGKGAKKRCEGGDNHPRLEIVEQCENPEPCIGDITSSEERNMQTPEQNEDETTTMDTRDGEGDDLVGATGNNCPMHDWENWSPCSFTCGGGYKERLRRPIAKPGCRKKIQNERRKCNWTPCPIPNYCFDRPMVCEERRTKRLKPGEERNMWFFNNEISRCQVFTWTCGSHMNRFKTHEKCEAFCITGRRNEMFNEPMNETETSQEEDMSYAGRREPTGRWNG